MHEEEQFFTLLEQVRREAKEKNNSITKERIRDIYKEMGLKEEQLSFLYDFLEKEHITTLFRSSVFLWKTTREKAY